MKFLDGLLRELDGVECRDVLVRSQLGFLLLESLELQCRWDVDQIPVIVLNLQAASESEMKGEREERERERRREERGRRAKNEE